MSSEKYIKWMQILNWREMPQFGRIHRLKKSEFFKNFYLPPKLEEVLSDLVFTLMHANINNDKLIIGKPGCGKTTFLYYLKKIKSYAKENIGDKYHFEILHFNRLISVNLQDSYESFEDICIKIYKTYLNVCGFRNKANLILKRTDIKNNTKINMLIDFIKDNSSKFSKKLIMLIDDIDESPIELVEPLLRRLYTYMETAEIEKWLTVRGATLDHYHESLLRFIRTKFSEKIIYPRIDLYGIVANRINTVDKDAKNPFGSGLCSQLIKAYNEDIRETLGVLKKFLELNEPGKTKEYSSSDYLEQYFNMSIPRVLIRQHVFPNIFLDSRSAQFPIEKDVFLLLHVKHTVDDKFVAALSQYYTATLKVLRRTKGKNLYGEETVTISRAEIDGCIEKFMNHQMLEKRAEDCFSITSKGHVFYRLIFSPSYLKECKEDVEYYGEKKYFPYWDFVSINPDFGTEIL